jgi:hypothetical protein
MSRNPQTSNSKKIPWVEIVSIIGALSWLPFIFDQLQKPEIHVKVISQYSNYGKFAGLPSTMLLYKMALVSNNKQFNLYDVKADITFKDYGIVHFSPFNPRITVFTDLNNVPRELNIDRSLYLNNSVVLKKDEPIVGYLLLSSPTIVYKDILNIDFIFINFKGDSSIVKVNMSSNKNQLLYDDDIWTPLSDTAINKLPKDLQRFYHRDMDSHLNK